MSRTIYSNTCHINLARRKYRMQRRQNLTELGSIHIVVMKSLTIPLEHLFFRLSHATVHSTVWVGSLWLTTTFTDIGFSFAHCLAVRARFGGSNFGPALYPTLFTTHGRILRPVLEWDVFNVMISRHCWFLYVYLMLGLDRSQINRRHRLHSRKQRRGQRL